jgi:cyclic dehypoxanthinyl futalosine synthase
MQLTDLYQKALNKEWLSIEEGMFLFENAPLTGIQ